MFGEGFMYFAISCIDKPGALAYRKEHRPAHIEYLTAHGAVVKFAGPYLDDDGETMVGSLLVIEAADRAAAEEFVASDPYTKAELFESVDIRPWKWAIGNPDF